MSQLMMTEPKMRLKSVMPSVHIRVAGLRKGGNSMPKPKKLAVKLKF